MEKVTLAQASTSPDVGRVERTYPVCIARKLTARYEALGYDLDELEAERDQLTGGDGSEDDDGDRAPDGGPKRNVPRHKGRVAEIDAETERIDAERAEVARRMEAHTNDLTLAGIEPHEWTAFVDEHPPRDVETPAGKRDAAVAFGIVDTDALIADLGRYAVRWGDEAVGDGHWSGVLYPNSSPRTLRALAQLVVLMHEDEAIVPKSPSGSFMTSANGTPSDSPETSE